MKVGDRAVDRRNPGEILGGLIPHARFTTMIILLINTALFLGDYVSPQSGLMQAGASIPAAMMHDQWWRLITAGFLHGGVLHILMNSWALFGLGAEVEQLFGTTRFIVMYFVATVAGFWTSSHLGFHMSVGSSAGIFGLIGAMIAFGLTDRTSTGSLVKSYYSQWLIWCVIISFMPGVDFWAHAGGFAGGFIVAWLARTPTAHTQWKEPLLRVLAGISITLTVAAFGMLYLAITRS